MTDEAELVVSGSPAPVASGSSIIQADWTGLVGEVPILNLPVRPVAGRFFRQFGLRNGNPCQLIDSLGSDRSGGCHNQLYDRSGRFFEW